MLIAAPALSGPVEVYREGERCCPRDLPATAPRIDVPRRPSGSRSRSCPTTSAGRRASIGGCDVVTENCYDSWRIYVHQYRRIPNAHDWAALTHTYVILDPVGNCIANIPGTEPGATR